jgi:thiamine biosynthesis lipoprotein
MTGPRVTTRRGLFDLLRGKPPERGEWIKVHRAAMACRFEVTLDDEDARHVEDARAALDEVDAIEAALTWFRDTSELSRVNREAALGPVAVGPFMAGILALCRELHAATAGRSIPRARRCRAAGGFLERQPRLPAEDDLARARASSGMDKVVLDEAGAERAFQRPRRRAELRRGGEGLRARPRVALAPGPRAQPSARLCGRQQPARLGPAGVGARARARAP